MNILLINHYAGSLKHGMEYRPYYFAREWLKMGHRVRIVAADFSHLRTVNPGKKADFTIEETDGIEYQWIHTWTYHDNGVRRALTIFQFVSKLWLHARWIAKEFAPDVVIASSTYPLDTYPARRISRCAGAKSVHETHDLWPLTLTEVGGMPKWNPFLIVMQIAENAAYRRSDEVVGLFSRAYEHMMAHHLRDIKKFTHIPNGVVLEDWKNSTPVSEDHRAAVGKARQLGNFIVCYLGGHALSNDLDVLLDAAGLLKDRPVSFVLVGKGVEKERLMEKAAKLGCENVIFLPPVDKKAVPNMLALADVLYVGATPGRRLRFGVSLNKVYDYMMAGKPILYGIEAPDNEVDEADCGLTIEAGNAEAATEAILRLMAMTAEQRADMGARGKNWVLENREYGKLAEKFLDVLYNK